VDFRFERRTVDVRAGRFLAMETSKLYLQDNSLRRHGVPPAGRFGALTIRAKPARNRAAAARKNRRRYREA